MAKKQNKEHDIAAMDRKNKKMFFSIMLAFFIFVGLTFTTPALYNLFCRVTGYGGTTQKVEAPNQHAAIDRDITIRFDANTSRKLPWVFKAKEKSVTIKIGEDRQVHYMAKNTGDVKNTGMALFNVTPQKAGKYFNKVECFCFNEQTLTPGEEADMLVSFYIEPKLAEDPYMDDVDTITLSYTFYPADSEELEEDAEKIYNN